MGDPPRSLLGLFFDAPSTPEQLAGPPDLAPAHSHSCDNFRICMKGELIVGKERYHHGEFRLQQSGRPYGQDGDAPHVDGNWRIIFFADRRGHLVRPTNPEIRAQYRAAAPAISERYGDLLPELLDDDDGGVVGMVTNLTTPLSKLGHIDSSFRGPDGWRRWVRRGLLSLHSLRSQARRVVAAHRLRRWRPGVHVRLEGFGS